MTKQRGSAFLAALLAAFAISACGSGESSGGTQQRVVKVPRDVYITSGDISAVHAGPARILLSWWRALQYGDPSLAGSVYSARAHPGDLARELAAVSSEFQSTRPVIQAVDILGDRATVLAVLESYQFGPKGAGAIDTAYAFHFVKQADGWKLADNSLLDDRYSAYRAAASTTSRPPPVTRAATGPKTVGTTTTIKH